MHNQKCSLLNLSSLKLISLFHHTQLLKTSGDSVCSLDELLDLRKVGFHFVNVMFELLLPLSLHLNELLDLTQLLQFRFCGFFPTRLEPKILCALCAPLHFLDRILLLRCLYFLRL